MENIANIDTAKQWYRKYWRECQKIEATYGEWRKKRDEAANALSGLRQFLQYSGVNMEELEQSLKSTTDTGEGIETKALPDLIYETLRDAGHPMHYGEILKALTTKGRVVEGKDPRNTMLAYISRHKKIFAKAPEKGKGYYKLRGQEA